LKNRIQKGLEVSPYGNGGITVQVEQGKTVLSGYVRDRDDMVDMIEIAYDSGATNVNNQLRIRDPRPSMEKDDGPEIERGG
jgi:osmotically-inducible protein OsmY